MLQVEYKAFFKKQANSNNFLVCCKNLYHRLENKRAENNRATLTLSNMV